MPGKEPQALRGEGRVHSLELIEQLMHERNEMLVLFNRVAGLLPFAGTGPGEAHLNELCGRLMEYVEDAQNQIYDRILNGAERRQEVVAVTRRLYPRIAQTSRTARGFCDRYAGAGEPTSREELKADLTVLGEELATRVELEERIWQALCRARGMHTLH